MAVSVDHLDRPHALRWHMVYVSTDMKRLYVYVIQALQPYPASLNIRSALAWAFASSGDEISERAWEHVRHSFPISDGFVEHRVMILTLDDETVAELVRLHSGDVVPSTDD